MGGKRKAGRKKQDEKKSRSEEEVSLDVDQSYLASVFEKVDADGSGEIGCMELQMALSNGTWTEFNQQTVRLLVEMFDKNGSGTINLKEFGALWKYIHDWKETFFASDEDNNGFIELDELKAILKAFGYRFSDELCERMVLRYDRSRTGHMHFDDFVHLCLVLQSLTDQFRSKDTAKTGKVLLRYQEFIEMVVNSRI